MFGARGQGGAHAPRLENWQPSLESIVVTRPFFSLNIVRLEEIFRDADVQTLRKLKEELSHRSTSRAKSLLKLVEKRLGNLSPIDQTSDSRGNETHSRSGQPSGRSKPLSAQPAVKKVAEIAGYPEVGHRDGDDRTAIRSGGRGEVIKIYTRKT